jgi:hypothetical protein
VQGDAARLDVLGQADVECHPLAGVNIESIETPFTFDRILATPVGRASIYISTHDVFPFWFGDEDGPVRKGPLPTCPQPTGNTLRSDHARCCRAISYQAEVSQSAEIDRTVTAAISNLGPLHIMATPPVFSTAISMLMRRRRTSGGALSTSIGMQKP